MVKEPEADDMVAAVARQPAMPDLKPTVQQLESEELTDPEHVHEESWTPEHYFQKI